MLYKFLPIFWYILLFLTIKVIPQPYLPLGFSSIITPHLDFSKLKLNLSTQCATETGMFVSSVTKSMKILETCKEDCLEKLQEHLFALKQLDASGKIPSGISNWVTVSEGSYESCRELDGEKYPTNYCYLHLVPGKDSICPTEKESNAMKMTMKLAICAPESCSSDDIVETFNGLHLPVPLTACRTFCVKNPAATFSFGFWMFSLFLLTMILLCSSATALDYYWRNTEISDLRFRVLACFSFYTNFKIIMEMKPEVTGVGAHLRPLNFLKFSCVSWVIIGHSPLPFLLGESVKPLMITRRYLSTHLTLDAMYSVETFFLISGLLMGYGAFKNPHLISLKSTWFNIIVRRYIRLMTPWIPWLGVVAFSAVFVRGPTISSLENYFDFLSTTCENSWWKLLFMTHNNWRPGDSCYPISWYVASDFQFFLIAPLILIPIAKIEAYRSSVESLSEL